MGRACFLEEGTFGQCMEKKLLGRAQGAPRQREQQDQKSCGPLQGQLGSPGLGQREWGWGATKFYRAGCGRVGGVSEKDGQMRMLRVPTGSWRPGRGQRETSGWEMGWPVLVRWWLS